MINMNEYQIKESQRRMIWRHYVKKNALGMDIFLRIISILEKIFQKRVGTG